MVEDTVDPPIYPGHIMSSKEAREIRRHITAASHDRRIRRAQIAAELGVSESDVYEWASGECEISAAHLAALAEYLGFDPLTVRPAFSPSEDIATPDHPIKITLPNGTVLETATAQQAADFIKAYDS